MRRLRHGAVMTQDDLAAAAGVSTDLIRKLEQGRRHTASIGSLHRIAAALDVDLGELLGRENLPEAAPDAGVVALREAVADVSRPVPGHHADSGCQGSHQELLNSP
jgi:transcriptional regulator with XRE-family HTH domain